VRETGGRETGRQREAGEREIDGKTERGRQGEERGQRNAERER